MKLLSALAVSACLLFGVKNAPADGRSTLVSVNGDGVRFVLGVMMSGDVCDNVAYRLNFYAQLPPEDPIRFYCRSPY